MITCFFPPNVGGVETHLQDFVEVLNEKKIKTTVLTYLPLTSKVDAAHSEKIGKFVKVNRLSWISGNFFYSFVNNPLVEFLYLFPSLFVYSLIYLRKTKNKISTIHSHGIISGAIGVILGIVFSKKRIVSLHSVYHFPQSGLYSSFVKWIFNHSNYVLTLSRQSKEEVEKLGIDSDKVKVFTYWVDQSNFKQARNSLIIEKRDFTVLFVGRLVEEKGIKILVQAIDEMKGVKCFIAGIGPLDNYVELASQKNKKIVYLGKVSQSDLPKYYNSCDLLIVPSIHEEGFGRVIIEALLCGLPVIASDRGGIKEAMNDSVGSLIQMNKKNLIKEINKYKNDKKLLANKARNAVNFSRKKYSNKNAEEIIKTYN